jgi:predicted dehydrogenase
MVEAVRRYGRVCQIGLQQRSASEFRAACKLVQQGALGKIETVYVKFNAASSEVELAPEPVPEGLDWDLWLGPAPWRPFNSRFHFYGPPKNVVPWDFCRDFGGGDLTSNAVHAFDFVQWALEMDSSGPEEIIPPESGLVPDLTFKYPGGVLLRALENRLDSKIHPIPKGWDEITSLQMFGALFVGDEGWLHVGRFGYLVSNPPQIARPFHQPQEQWPATDNHRRDWLDSIRTRGQPTCDVAVGCRSTTISLAACIARWNAKALKWDAAQSHFVADEQANRMRQRAMRAPWRV